MAKRNERVIIDTNLWISFLIKRDYSKLDNIIKRGGVRIVFSLELMEEFLTVASRPKFRKYFSQADLDELLDLMDVFGEMVDVKSKVDMCRDPKDNFLLSLARDSQAGILITGDQDLLELSNFEKTRIVSMTEYLKKFQR